MQFIENKLIELFHSHKIPVLLELLHEFDSFDCFSFSARSRALSIKVVKFLTISSSDISFF